MPVVLLAVFCASTCVAAEKGPAIDWDAVDKSPDLKGVYAARSPKTRKKALKANGGSEETEAAVLRALRWLKKHQKEDGSWDGKSLKNDRHVAATACTAFALLTFLGHGETHDSEEFGKTVRKSVDYLLAAQKDDGRFLHSDGHDYTHPIAAFALCEAYAMTQIEEIKEAAEKSIVPIVKGQNTHGGWNYNMRVDTRCDTSYMGWCAQAVRAAQTAGLEVEGLARVCTKAVDGFKKNSHPEGGFGYTSPSKTHGLTGVGTYCMAMLGQANSPEFLRGIGVITERSKVSWAEPKGKIYYWYYDIAAMFRNGGQVWQDWNAQAAPDMADGQIVLKSEGEGGKDIGYWETPAGVRSHCPTFINTCLCAMSLEVYYRYTPAFAKAD